MGLLDSAQQSGTQLTPQQLDLIVRGQQPGAKLTPEMVAAIVRGDYGDQVSRWSEQAANPYYGFGGRPGNLTPEQVAQLKQGIVPEGYSIGIGGYESRGDQGIDSAQDPYYVLYQGMEDPTWGTAKWNTWDLGGNYLGYGSADSELRGVVKAAALAAAMYGGAAYGAQAMGTEGAAGGAGGGAASTAGAGGSTAGAGGAGAATGNAASSITSLAPASVTPASASTAAAAMPTVNVAASGAAGASAGAAGAGGGGGTAGSSGVNAMRAGEIAGYSSNGAMPSSAASTAGNMGMLDWAGVAANGTTGTEGLIGSGGNMATSSGGTSFSTGSLFNGMTTKDWVSVLGTGLQYLDQRKQAREAVARSDAQRAQDRQWDLEDRAYLEKLQREKWARIGSTGGGLLNSAMTRTGG